MQRLSERRALIGEAKNLNGSGIHRRILIFLRAGFFFSIYLFLIV